MRKKALVPTLVVDPPVVLTLRMSRESLVAPWDVARVGQGRIGGVRMHVANVLPQVLAFGKEELAARSIAAVQARGRGVA